MFVGICYRGHRTLLWEEPHPRPSPKPHLPGLKSCHLATAWVGGRPPLFPFENGVQ